MNISSLRIAHFFSVVIVELQVQTIVFQSPVRQVPQEFNRSLNLNDSGGLRIFILKAAFLVAG